MQQDEEKMVQSAFSRSAVRSRSAELTAGAPSLKASPGL